jgi:hypothetical protein
MDNLPKAIELLLKDIGENALLSWDVEEITEKWDLGVEPLNTKANNSKEEFEI